MEEDIGYLEMLKDMIDEDYGNGKKYKQAIENLINKYKEYEECLEVTSQALNNIAYDQIPIAIGEQEEEIEKLQGENEELKEKNEHYTDLIDALETYYDITEEDLENSVKEDK